MRQAAPHEGLIDYPFTAAKSDWMDVYLASRCRFHIGTASGMSFVPLLFGRPVLMTNWITPAHMICSPSVVTLPKLLLDRSGIPVPMAVWCDRYRDLLERPDADLDGLMLHDNTPSEILEAVELVDRHIDPASGRLILSPSMFAESQAVFARSPLRIQPQIPPGFWRRYYG
jgi:putative glycosyltransferase (TIGR04372 family)